MRGRWLGVRWTEIPPDYQEILEWLRSLPGRVAVAYEAGPTGLGLARFLVAAGVMCLVAVASKRQRPTGDRVKDRCP